MFDEWGTIPGYVPALPTWLAAQGYRTVLAASERELATPEPGVTRLFERVVATLGHPAQPSAVTARRLVHALEDLESGALGPGWSTVSSDAQGRIQVTGEFLNSRDVGSGLRQISDGRVAHGVGNDLLGIQASPSDTAFERGLHVLDVT